MLRLKIFRGVLPQREEPWTFENLREISLDELFARCRAANDSVDRALFLRLAEESDTPEELTDRLWVGGGDL